MWGGLRKYRPHTIIREHTRPGSGWKSEFFIVREDKGQAIDPRPFKQTTLRSEERPIGESSELLIKDVTDPSVGPIGERAGAEADCRAIG